MRAFRHLEHDTPSLDYHLPTSMLEKISCQLQQREIRIYSRRQGNHGIHWTSNLLG